MHSNELFPKCNLYGSRVVDALPDGCPLAQPNPLDAVHGLRVRGYRRFGRGEDGGTDDHHRADVCDECVCRLLRNRTVQRLRGLHRGAKVA